MANHPLAFPQPMVVIDGRITSADEYSTGTCGMELRDWFAGQALAGLMADSTVRPDSELQFEHLAKRLYQVADAMLVERLKAGAR